jgi:uncharacterized membrane protein YedE/YeeE
MLDLLPQQLPWYVTGPAIGLCVVTMCAVASLRLGVSGSWLQLLTLASGRRPSEPWRLWFLGGLVVGAAAYAVLSTDVGVHGYGALSDLLPVAVLLLVLLLAGLAIGYGARWAGGCTSGHGISGCSVGSPGSLATTAVFFAVAVGVTLLLNALTGGRL